MWLPALGALAALALEGSLKEFREVLGLRSPDLRWILVPPLAVLAAYATSAALAVSLGYSLTYCGALKDLAEDLGFWTVPLLLAAGVLAGLSVNGLAALGEEVGWRGYLLVRLSDRLGLWGSALAVGVVWGLWHAPLILRGYDYSLELLGSCGRGSSGLPALLAFTAFTTSLGILLAALRILSKSTYSAAIAHGTVNGVAGLFSSIVSGPRILAPPAGLLVAASFVIISIPFVLRMSGVEEGLREAH